MGRTGKTVKFSLPGQTMEGKSWIYIISLRIISKKWQKKHIVYFLISMLIILSAGIKNRMKLVTLWNGLKILSTNLVCPGRPRRNNYGLEGKV